MKKKLQDYFRIYSEHKGITIQESEKIFNTVYKTIKKAESPSILIRFKSPFAIGAAAVAAVVLLSLPAFWLHEKYLRSQSAVVVDSEEYSVKGGVKEPFVVVECTGSRERGVCHRESVMVFKIIPPLDQSYFSAFSRHIESNKAIWYYPETEDGKSLFIEQADVRQILTDGIVIDDDHPLGDYEVVSVFSNKSLSWNDIRKLFDDSGHLTQSSYTVLKSRIRIEK